MNAWPKGCQCGREYTAEAWARLPYVGVQRLEGDDVPLELRNCPCKSTLAIEIPTSDVTDEAA